MGPANVKFVYLPPLVVVVTQVVEAESESAGRPIFYSSRTELLRREKRKPFYSG